MTHVATNATKACGVAYVLALLALTAVVGVSAYLRPPNVEDIAGYYIGGVMVREGRWDALYPTNTSGTPYAIFDNATLPPAQVARAQELGVPPFAPYLHPPWNALMWAPVSMVPFHILLPLYMGFCILCGWACAVLAGRAYRMLAGRPTWTEAALVLVCAVSPLVYRSVRVMNVSTVVALCLAVGLFGTMARRSASGKTARVNTRDARDTLAIWLSGILKYAGAALIPLLVLTHRWRVILGVGLLGMVAIGVSVALVPGELWSYYLGTVAPSLPRSSPMPTNQSIWGLILRATGEPITPSTRRAVSAIHVLLWVVVIGLMWRHRKCDWRRPELACAAFAAPTCLMLTFAPVMWEHYLMYLLPLFGWVWWEASRSRFRHLLRVVVVVGLFPAWGALPALTWFRPVEPFGTSLLLSVVLIFCVAVVRLWRGPVRTR